MANRDKDVRRRIISDRGLLKKSKQDFPSSNRPKNENLLQQLKNGRNQLNPFQNTSSNGQ